MLLLDYKGATQYQISSVVRTLETTILQYLLQWKTKMISMYAIKKGGYFTFTYKLQLYPLKGGGSILEKTPWFEAKFAPDNSQ